MTSDPPSFPDLSAAARWHGAWLAEGALPLWSTAGVDAGRGSFQEGLTARGEPVPGPRRVRVQARQVWTFATASALGFGPAYREVATRAAAFLVDRYRRPDGLFARAADQAGAIVDDVAALYDQAFVLLAFAAIGEAGEARSLRERIETFRASNGGWREAGERPFQANAQMHLLEAALAWESQGAGDWAQVADEIAELALVRFIAPDGALREFFDEAWRPLDDAGAGLIEPGHQFEWAWLLRSWGLRRGRPDALARAEALYRHGQRGIDPDRGVVVGAIWPDGAVRDPVARVWAQTERLRAALELGSEGEALAAAKTLARFYDTPVRGVWRERMERDGRFLDEPAPGTTLYHLMSGLRPLLERG